MLIQHLQKGCFQAEMRPKMHAIDMALNLNLDEHGNPRPVTEATAEALRNHSGSSLLVTPLKPESNDMTAVSDLEESMPILIREEQIDDQKSHETQKGSIKSPANGTKNLQEREGTVRFFSLKIIIIIFSIPCESAEVCEMPSM